MESARVQTPFVLLQAIPLAGLTRGAGSGRMAFRGGRQNVAGNRLSAFILHFLGRVWFAYFRSVPAPRPFARFSQGLS